MAMCLMALDLPENPPLPEPRPKAQAEQPPEENAPEGENAGEPVGENAPQVKAGEAAGDKTPEDQQAVEQVEEDLPDEPPVPEQRAENPPPPDPAPPEEDIAAFNRCTAALTALGAKFEVLDTINDDGVCGMDKPLKVTMVMEGVELVPEGTMRCETALALANWSNDYVNPTARIALSRDARLTKIDQASTYVCRSRNNIAGARVSEHAKGNAVDVRSLTFSNGDTVEMLPRMKDGTATGAFQRTVSAAACLYFTTVLSPGSDATHQDHMHLDVIERESGYRYCR